MPRSLDYGRPSLTRRDTLIRPRTPRGVRVSGSRFGRGAAHRGRRRSERAELDALVTWIGAASTGPIAAGPAGDGLAGALNAAIQPAPADAVQPSDVVSANATGWATPARNVALRPAGEIVAVTWGLAPSTSVAADVSAVAPGRYAIALSVDGDAALTPSGAAITPLVEVPA